MARKRMTLDDDRIVTLMRGGRTAEQIAHALTAEGVKVSRATVTRRMRDLRDQVHAQRAKGKSIAPPDSSGSALPDPDEIPEGASVVQLDRWIRQAEEGINRAQEEGDLALMATMLRVASALAETKRKATPAPPPDPNAHPDMIAAARRAREALHKLVDSATTEGA